MDLSIQPYLDVSERINDVVDAGAVLSDDGKAIVLRDYLAANYERLYRRLLRHLGSPDQAGDCLHDAWLRLGEMTMPATVRHPEAYVYRVACNLAMDRLRSGRSWQSFGDAGEEMEALVDPLPGPDLVAEARSELAAVERAIRCLPGRHQHVLMDLRINELTRLEVAALYGLSLRRIDTILHQALDYCAQHAGQQVLAGVRAPRRALPERMSA